MFSVLTKVILEEEERDDVDEEGDGDGDAHGPVEGADGEGHHQQLRDDQGSEGDGHHVDELVLEEQQGAEHDDAAWKQC